uniref:Aminotransferase-like plant mobile domain-containing protein n=1 Tax=Ananas comosus var. bracteatus TaxID=296719 RepID=A0A6V7P542_ANACO|nr:unnamed protein product [Ananas comosus var. bracteatus]
MYEEFKPRNCDLDIYNASLTSLLTVYEWLTIRNQGGPVYYNHWIDYWYRGDIASSSRPRLISDDEHCIGPPIRDNGYKAAFLSLWLYKFIMPSGQRDTIRPEVFVMASKLAKQNLLAESAHHSLQQTYEIPDVPNSSLLVHNRFEPNIVTDQIAAKRGLPEDSSRRDPKRPHVDASMAAMSVTRENGRNHNPLIDVRAIVADLQGIASPREIEDSIPSRYNLEVDYEPTPSVSKDNSDSSQKTRQKVEDLERTLAAARAKQAKLNDEVNTINECLFRLDLGKDKVVAMMEGAIDEFGATKGSHSMTVEFNHLSNLIKDFEHHCKESCHGDAATFLCHFLGGKGSSLTPAAVYAIAGGLSGVRIDASALEKLAQSKSSSPSPPLFDAIQNPRFLTPEESRATLDVLLNKLLVADASVRPPLPTLIEEVLSLPSGHETLDFGSPLRFLESICRLNGRKVEEINISGDEIEDLKPPPLLRPRSARSWTAAPRHW